MPERVSFVASRRNERAVTFVAGMLGIGTCLLWLYSSAIAPLSVRGAGYHVGTETRTTLPFEAMLSLGRDGYLEAPSTDSPHGREFREFVERERATVAWKKQKSSSLPAPDAVDGSEPAPDLSNAASTRIPLREHAMHGTVDCPFAPDAVGNSPVLSPAAETVPHLPPYGLSVLNSLLREWHPSSSIADTETRSLSSPIDALLGCATSVDRYSALVPPQDVPWNLQRVHAVARMDVFHGVVIGGTNGTDATTSDTFSAYAQQQPPITTRPSFAFYEVTSVTGTTDSPRLRTWIVQNLTRWLTHLEHRQDKPRPSVLLHIDAYTVSSMPSLHGAESDAQSGTNRSFCHGMPMTMSMSGFRWSLRNNDSDNKLPPCFTYLTPQWTLDDASKFRGAMFFTFLLAILTEWVSSLSPALRNHWRAPTPARKIVLAIFYGVNQWFGYISMIITMSYSYELFLSLIVGLMVGNSLFRTVPTQTAHGNTAPSANINSQTGELDARRQYRRWDRSASGRPEQEPLLHSTTLRHR